MTATLIIQGKLKLADFLEAQKSDPLLSLGEWTKKTGADENAILTEMEPGRLAKLRQQLIDVAEKLANEIKDCMASGDEDRVAKLEKLLKGFHGTIDRLGFAPNQAMIQVNAVNVVIPPLFDASDAGAMRTIDADVYPEVEDAPVPVEKQGSGREEHSDGNERREKAAETSRGDSPERPKKERRKRAASEKQDA